MSFTCSMTSGAIQHGVPTNVLRTLFLVMSPPVDKKALTPKSASRRRKDNKGVETAHSLNSLTLDYQIRHGLKRVCGVS